jgi:MFS transporter, NNP family, nitrate/nitrite transporter
MTSVAASTVPQGYSKTNIFRLVRHVGQSRHISQWDAEDLAAWEAGNKTIARRNLFWSVVIVHLGYSIWSLWPVRLSRVS